MTGQDFQDKLDAIVTDLQTAGKGKTVNIAMRRDDNSVANFPLSSDANGVVNVAQFADISGFLDDLKNIANTYTTEYAPVQVALDVYNTERGGHQALIDAASAARTALSNALEADAQYQTAKTALDAARANQDYINARANYVDFNVSENYGNLSDAKGKYVA